MNIPVRSMVPRARAACRHVFIFILLFAGRAVTAQEDLSWHDAREWGVEGRAWQDQERARWFDRFPAKAEGKVTGAVWNLSRHSAGMMVRFKTDSPAIHAKWKLLSANLGMPHMPPSGVSGLDLYARDDQGRWRWAAATRPNKQEMEAKLLDGIAPGFREYAVYLPLYNGVESLEIGVVSSARFEGLAPRQDKPLVFYGTSITHGACASRPGMAHPAILGRRFDRPVINLGFSGNGRMDAPVGELMTEIDAAVFLIDCLPNMNAASVTEKAVPLVKQIRAARPNTPIVLVEDRRYANSWLTPEKDAFHDDNHDALKNAFETLVSEGTTRIFYLDGDRLLGGDAEGSTDASHPNDLGFMRQADAFEPVIREALELNDDPFGNTFYSEIDVIDRDAPEVRPIESKQAKPSARVVDVLSIESGKYEASIDTSETPDLTEWSRREVAPMVEEWYPKIVAALPSEGFEAPSHFRIVFSADMRGVAATGGDNIRCAADWFRRNLEGEAVGAIYHELVHVVQQYRRARRDNPDATRTPGWLVEGIADYLRWFQFEPESRGAEITRRNIDRARYDASYRVTANFLDWVVKNHDPEIVQKLNAAARTGEYREALWKEHTGLTVQELGEAWKSFHEKRIAEDGVAE